MEVLAARGEDETMGQDPVAVEREERNVGEVFAGKGCCDARMEVGCEGVPF